jgi:hypothetical protein
MQLALEKLEQEKKGRIIEEITLDDDNDEEEDVKNTNVKETDSFVDNAEIRKLAVETTDKLFSDLRSMMNGKNMINKAKNEEVHELFKDKDSITQYFSKLKEKVGKYEIPKEMEDQLRNCKLKPEKSDNFMNLKCDANTFQDVKEETLSKKRGAIFLELINPCDVCKIDFETNCELKKHMESHEGAAHVNKNKGEDKPRNISKQEKRFICPLPLCTFWTNKVGMKGGKAAIHLSKDHLIKPKHMTPGQFKFNKVTVNI